MSRRLTLIVLVVLLRAEVAAHGVVLFLDVGDSATGVRGGPLDHSNPDVAVPPNRTIALYLWGIPDADDSKVIAALGHDIQVTGSADAWITATEYIVDNPPIGAGDRWTGANLVGGLNTPGKLVDDQRAVFVPAAEPFVGGLGSGFLDTDPAHDASSGAVLLAQLILDIDAQAVPGTSVDLRLAVSPLLIASAAAAPPSDEPLFLGYDASGPEAATGNGSVIGATSAFADATITVVTLGDADADGDVDLDDFTEMSGCLDGPSGATTSACTVFDHEPDGDVDLDDFRMFQLSFDGP
jgi:hypothetical protein